MGEYSLMQIHQPFEFVAVSQHKPKDQPQTDDVWQDVWF